MTDVHDLPFVHPPHDPPPGTEERVRERVHASARRRRTRRRLLATVSVVVVVAGLAVAAVAAARSADDPEEVATDTTVAEPADELEVEPTVSWSIAILSRDGRTLTVEISGSAGAGPCGEGEVVHDVLETETEVVVGFEALPVPPTTTTPGIQTGCTLMASIEQVDVALREPLGDRPVFDGVSDEPVEVLRLDGLVEVGHVPEGFTADPPYMQTASEPSQQTYWAEGADWYFAVNQVPIAAGWQGYDDEEGTPITVGGRPAELITGQMNGTMETIRFERDGLIVSVWGEMQGPPTFTHRDELVRIAEGIGPPPGP